MASLLAAGLLLGLFWLFSPLFWFLGDKVSKIEKNANIAQHVAVGNVYVLAWARLEELQKECIDANPDQKYNPCIVTWYNFRHEVSMQEEAIIDATNELRSRKQLTVKSTKKSPYAIHVVHPNEPFNVEKYSKYIEQTMPPLYGQYQFDFPCRPADKKAEAIMRSLWDRERSSDNRVIYKRPTSQDQNTIN